MTRVGNPAALGCYCGTRHRRVKIKLERRGVYGARSRRVQISGFSFRAVGVSVVAAMLSGCVLTQPGSELPDGASQNTSVVAERAAHGSWMLSEASSEDLLYVSNTCSGSCDVYVFSYPGAKLVGMLRGFVNPSGLCSDKKGNVWITDDHGGGSAGDIVEYAHGGTKPIARLKDVLSPQACSVDPSTGDLAVANSSYAVLGIYKRARGQPKWYSGYGGSAYSCSYDSFGNVFLAVKTGFHVKRVGWLRKGRSKVKRLPMSPPIEPAAGVFWDGHYLTSEIRPHFLVRYILSGQGAKRVDYSDLSNSAHLSAYWIQGSFVVGAIPSGNVLFWSYPSGGGVVKLASVPTPGGVTVSVLPR